MRREFILIIALLIILHPTASQSNGIGVSLNLISQTCYDGLQNQNETGVDCGGPCTACQNPPAPKSNGGGGNGGGGGGGSSGPIIENPLNGQSSNEYTQYYFFAKDSVTGKINLTGLSVSGFELDLTSSKNNITVSIKDSGDNLTINAMPSDLVYQYFKVDASNLNLADIRNATLTFKVNKSWVKEKNVSFDSFSLYNYNGVWNELSTGYVAQDDKYYYFESGTNILGYFAILGRKTAQANISAPVNENPITKAINIIEKPELINELSTYEKTELILLSVIITCLICYSIFRIYKRIWMSDEKDELKVSEALEEEKRKIEQK